ncbi:MAG: TonB-dependent receptor [Ferruginibacter sp.]
MKKIFLLSTMVCTLISGFGQQKNRTILSGKITDAKTGLVLSGASIILVEAKQATLTDSNGIYTFSNIPTGHTLLEISFTGYRSIVEHLDIIGTTEKNYALSSAIIENESVTVTAVGSAISIRKAPIAITRVNKEQLLSSASTNIIDALSKQPGVSQVTTGPAISKPVIRGLGYNRLVVINDGLRQEGQQWGDEHGIEIDENSVNRIEIVKGPASLIYGSDAMAGVVNIITTVTPVENTIKGNILASYGSNNQQRSLFANLGGNHIGFNWNAWGDYKAAADYKNKYDGKVWNSKFNEKNFGGYVGYNGAWGFSHIIVSSFNQKLGVIEGERDNDGNFIKQLPGGLQAVPSQNDFNSIDPSVPYQSIRHTKIIADNSFKAGSGRLSLNVGLQKNQRQEFGNPDNISEPGLFFELNTFNYSTAYHFHDHNGWNNSIGLNGMIQANKNKGEAALIPEYNLFDLGGFIYLQKTNGKATYSAGIRYDTRSLNSKQFSEAGSIRFESFKRNFSNLSGSAGMSYALSDKILYKINVARGFRSPSIPELASNGQHEGTNRYEIGAVNLRSETSWQGDFGLEVNAEHVFFTASTFYNAINNFIFYSKLASVNGGDSLVNGTPAFKFGQQDARLAGVEAMIDLHPHPLDWLHWQNTFSYVRGVFKKDIESTNNLPFIPSARFISQLRADIFEGSKSKGKLSVFAELDHTFNQQKPFTAFDTETATDRYSLFNAGITADIKNKNKTLFSIYVLANNLGDKAYQNHLSRLKYTAENLATGRTGVFNMGRNFLLKINMPLSFENKKKGK